MKEKAVVWFDTNGLLVNDNKTDELPFSLSSKTLNTNKSVKQPTWNY